MIYRIVPRGGWFFGDTDLPYPPRRASGHPRARFWFTEEGWKRFGAAIASHVALRGSDAVLRVTDAGTETLDSRVKVVRAKNPPRSRVLWRDRYQLLVLPDRPRRRSKRGHDIAQSGSLEE